MIKKEALLMLLLILGTVLLLGGTYSLGSAHGKAVVQNEWNQVKEQQAGEIGKLKVAAASSERLHRQEVGKINDELHKLNHSHETAMADAQRQYADRVQQLEHRASVYQRLSQAGAFERDRLASYAAGLDRSLEEGRYLVRELGETVKQRDRTIELLSRQIRADRELLE